MWRQEGRVALLFGRSEQKRHPHAELFEGDFVDRLLDLVDDHVGELGSLLAVQSLT
jgi:hypothetical protein